MPHYLRSMLQRAMRTFRILTWMGIALFWMLIFLTRAGVAFILQDLILSSLFTVAILVMLQAFTVMFYLIQESDENLKKEDTFHRKLYKALEHLDDIDNC